MTWNFEENDDKKISDGTDAVTMPAQAHRAQAKSFSLESALSACVIAVAVALSPATASAVIASPATIEVVGAMADLPTPTVPGFDEAKSRLFNRIYAKLKPDLDILRNA